MSMYVNNFVAQITEGARLLYFSSDPKKFDGNETSLASSYTFPRISQLLLKVPLNSIM